MARYKEQEALQSQQQTNCDKKNLQQRLQLKTDASERHSHRERRQKETKREETKEQGTGTPEVVLDSRNQPLATKDCNQFGRRISLDEHQSDIIRINNNDNYKEQSDVK